MYSPFITRPIDTVSKLEPVDIRRGTIYTDAKPDKFQHWCSEKDAINYHAMRPVMTDNMYETELRRLFKLIGPNTKYNITNNWRRIYEGNSLIDYIMNTLNNAVNHSDIFKRNGPYQVEQFYYTDAEFYELIPENFLDKRKIYKILFYLLNPLRSVSKGIECNIIIENKQFKIIYINFINEEITEQIDGHLFGKPGAEPQISNNVNNYDPFKWSYINTINDQTIYANGKFHEITGGISPELSAKILLQIKHDQGI